MSDFSQLYAVWSAPIEGDMIWNLDHVQPNPAQDATKKRRNPTHQDDDEKLKQLKDELVHDAINNNAPMTVVLDGKLSHLMNVLAFQSNSEKKKSVTTTAFEVIFREDILFRERFPLASSLVVDLLENQHGTYLMSLDHQQMRFQFVYPCWRLIIPDLTTASDKTVFRCDGGRNDPQLFTQNQLFLHIEFNDGVNTFAFCGVVLAVSKEALNREPLSCYIKDEQQIRNVSTILKGFKSTVEAYPLEDELSEENVDEIDEEENDPVGLTLSDIEMDVELNNDDRMKLAGPFSLQNEDSLF